MSNSGSLILLNAIFVLIDVPRSHLVKYPLLFQNILKYTAKYHEDYEKVKDSIASTEDILEDVNKNVAETKCQFTKDHLEFLDEEMVCIFTLFYMKFVLIWIHSNFSCNNHIMIYPSDYP